MNWEAEIDRIAAEHAEAVRAAYNRIEQVEAESAAQNRKLAAAVEEEHRLPAEDEARMQAQPEPPPFDPPPVPPRQQESVRPVAPGWRPRPPERVLYPEDDDDYPPKSWLV